MNSRIFAFAALLLSSACAITPQSDGSMAAQFQPPIVEHNWQMKPYTLADGNKACAISSGYNGLTILLSHPPGHPEGIVVESNRRMEPGTTLAVSINGKNYETYDHYFSADVGRAMVKEFARGGTAYFDWSEISGPPGPGRIDTTNIVHLGDFNAQMKQCEDAFAAAH